MTSEIAVMNRGAVALAADSAVSVSTGRRNKVYNSANKLFMLSELHPVGIMVYSNGSLMGVPWEVLIKSFRTELATTEFARLEEYGAAFIAYLEKQTKDLFTPELERDYFLKLVASQFDELAREIQREITRKEVEYSDEAAWDAARKEIVSRHIRDCHQKWSDMPPHPSIEPETGKKFRGSCSGELAQLATKNFRSRFWTAASEDTKLLFDLAEFYVEKAYIASPSFSGMVVAGFGKSEFFPVLKRYRIGHFYEGHLKVLEVDPVMISEKEPVHVGVYADSDMADLFLRGVSLGALEIILESVFEAGAELVETTIDATGVAQTPELWSKVEKQRDDILLKLVERIEGYRSKTSELEEALTHIPKDELASVAASLVNLNSFKKRMSMGVESVGGPVDVAVISKGDGFIWIDRKHYFEADKNPHFMRRISRQRDSKASA